MQGDVTQVGSVAIGLTNSAGTNQHHADVSVDTLHVGVMPAVALTIAGSDPSGGAGIQADLKTFHQFGVYGEAVITLLTVQNTQAVSRSTRWTRHLVTEQMQAVLDDIPPLPRKRARSGVSRSSKRSRRWPHRSNSRWSSIPS